MGKPCRIAHNSPMQKNRMTYNKDPEYRSLWFQFPSSSKETHIKGRNNILPNIDPQPQDFAWRMHKYKLPNSSHYQMSLQSRQIDQSAPPPKVTSTIPQEWTDGLAVPLGLSSWRIVRAIFVEVGDYCELLRMCFRVA